MSEDLNNAINTLIACGAHIGQPRSAPGGNFPYVVVPQGYKTQALPELIFNEHAARPERIKGTVKVTDPESFVAYYKLFADADSRVFAYEPNSSVTAILDYHEHEAGSPVNSDPEAEELPYIAASPRWCQHRVVLDLQKSPEWLAWFGNNNTPMAQMAFAEFLEQYGGDITDPASATMMEVANDLEAHTGVEFQSSAKTLNGQIQLKYTQTTKATIGNQSMEVPSRFTITIPVFVGSTPIPMTALLRYRVNNAALSLHYTLVRPENVLRDAFRGARDKIAADLDLTVIAGQPAA